MGSFTVQKSTNLASAELTTGSLKSLLDNGVINIYSGTPPASADAAIGGGNTLLAQICKGDASVAYDLVWDTPAVNGVLKKPNADTWSTPTTDKILASGTATFWRWNKTGDDNSAAASGTNYRLQGLVGADASFSLFLQSAALVAGNSINLAAFQIINPTA